MKLLVKEDVSILGWWLYVFYFIYFIFGKIRVKWWFLLIYDEEFYYMYNLIEFK